MPKNNKEPKIDRKGRKIQNTFDQMFQIIDRNMCKHSFWHSQPVKVFVGRLHRNYRLSYTISINADYACRADVKITVNIRFDSKDHIKTFNFRAADYPDLQQKKKTFIIQFWKHYGFYFGYFKR